MGDKKHKKVTSEEIRRSFETINPIIRDDAIKREAHQNRVVALQAAATSWSGLSAISDRPESILETAKKFEIYLRGEEEVTVEQSS